MNAVQRLSRIILTCSEPDRLADFYEAAFGFVRTDGTAIAEPSFAKLLDIPGAIVRVIALQLGDQKIELIGVQPPGRSYPRAITGRSRIFQHFAIVVSDMATACAPVSYTHLDVYKRQVLAVRAVPSLGRLITRIDEYGLADPILAFAG